jgi:hypothetical protein
MVTPGYRKFLFLGMLLSFLAACGQPAGKSTPPPDTAAGDLEVWARTSRQAHSAYLAESAPLALIDAQIMSAQLQRNTAEMRRLVTANRKAYAALAEREMQFAEAFRAQPLPPSLTGDDLDHAKTVVSHYASSYDRLNQAHTALARAAASNLESAFKSFLESRTAAGEAENRAKQEQNELLQKYHLTPVL